LPTVSVRVHLDLALRLRPRSTYAPPPAPFRSMGWFMCCYYHILLNTDYKNARPLNTPSHITQSANGMGRVWYGGGKHAKQARAHLNRAPTRHAPVQVLTRPLLLVPHGRRRGTSTTTCRASGATQASPCLGADNARSPHASIGPPRCGYIYVCVCVCVYIYIYIYIHIYIGPTHAPGPSAQPVCAPTLYPLQARSSFACCARLTPRGGANPPA